MCLIPKQGVFLWQKRRNCSRNFHKQLRLSCVVLIDSSVGIQIFCIVILGLLYGKLALFSDLGNNEIFLAFHLQQGGNKAENTLLQAFFFASLKAFFQNTFAEITYIGCPPLLGSFL